MLRIRNYIELRWVFANCEFDWIEFMLSLDVAWTTQLVYTVELTWRIKLLFIMIIRLEDGFRLSGAVYRKYTFECLSCYASLLPFAELALLCNIFLYPSRTQVLLTLWCLEMI
jgi:hypothetical protein